MPNKKSAKKELRKGDKRAKRNVRVEDDIKNLIKDSRKAIDSRDAKAKELVAKALQAIDKAAQRGVIKKNTRDRKKSRLQLKLNKSSK